MKPSEEFEEGRALWQRLRRRRSMVDGACPDPIEVAGYLDGRLTPAEIEAMEDHLARCAACCELVIAYREERELPLPMVPRALRDRARSIPSAGPAALAVPAGRRLLVAASVIAACLAAGWMGYELGSGTASYEVRRREALGEAITFGLASGLAGPLPAGFPGEQGR